MFDGTGDDVGRETGNNGGSVTHLYLGRCIDGRSIFARRESVISAHSSVLGVCTVHPLFHGRCLYCPAPLPWSVFVLTGPSFQVAVCTVRLLFSGRCPYFPGTIS